MSEFDDSPLEKIANAGRNAIMLKLKYQLLWCFRSIEAELESSDGMIIVKDEGKFNLKDFSPSLIEKMQELFKQGQDLGYFE